MTETPGVGTAGGPSLPKSSEPRPASLQSRIIKKMKDVFFTSSHISLWTGSVVVYNGDFCVGV